MSLPAEKIRSLYLGVDPADYEFIPPQEKERNIGFISRLCYENGLDILVEAFIQLKKRTGFEDTRLKLTGGSTGVDTKYIRELKNKIKNEKLTAQVEFMYDFEADGRQEFFSQVSVISVPVRNGEAFGMYLLESMASGIPVVQPALGAFPEIINFSGGGLIYEPNTPEALCEALAGLLKDSSKLESLSLNARLGVERSFNIHDHARDMIELYKSL